ncbi:unnamed protein product [Arabidopsis halleri]
MKKAQIYIFSMKKTNFKDFFNMKKAKKKKIFYEERANF